MTAGAKKTSPWIYVGLGCATLIVIVIALCAAALYFTHQWKEHMADGFRDPVYRTAQAQEILHCDRFPEGLRAMLGVSLPFVGRAAILSDRELTKKEEIRGFDRQGFAYLQLSGFFTNRASIRERYKSFLQGTISSTDFWNEHRFMMDRGFDREKVAWEGHEVLSQGAFPDRDYQVTYRSQRGDLQINRDVMKVIGTFMLIECPKEDPSAMAFWLKKDPAPDEPASALDLEGTPADELAVRSFLQNFQPCP